MVGLLLHSLLVPHDSLGDETDPIEIKVGDNLVFFDRYRPYGVTKFMSPYKFLSSNQKKDILFRFISLGAVAQKPSKPGASLRVWISGAAVVDDKNTLKGFVWFYLSKCAPFHVHLLLVSPNLEWEFKETLSHIKDLTPDLTINVPSDVVKVFEEFHETRLWKEEGFIKENGSVTRKLVQYNCGYVDSPSPRHEPCKSTSPNKVLYPNNVMCSLQGI